MSRRPLAITPLLVFLLLLNAGGQSPESILIDAKPPDGSRSKAAHRIPLYDERGQEIFPDDTPVLPFSTRMTCGPCHDYEAIRHGWHFNSPDAEVPAGRPGEPWVLVDEKTGTQLPVSNRAWPGAWRPRDCGLTPWRFTQIFARHMPGGDMGDLREEIPSPESRWGVSGALEINCLTCHAASPEYDPSEYAIQTARENFRWAATAASGFATVEGLAFRQHPTWNIYDGPDPDNVYLMPPTVDYDLTRFDKKRRVFFDLTRRPPAERCYFCHSTPRAAEADRQALLTDADVHTRSGMACVDCHRNGLDHYIVRGYDGEARDRGAPVASSLSCKGCHLGPEPRLGGPSLAGRFGAPRPAHKGLPVVHLDKMTCTACHSGPWPTAEPELVRTSRANRLGIHGKAQWFTDLPFISSPVFARQADGKIAPHHVFWPAFWGRLEGDKVAPIPPEEVSSAAGEILEPEKQVARPLGAFNSLAPERSEAVYLLRGKVYRWYAEGRIQDTARTCPEGPPTWSWMGTAERPAASQAGAFEPLIGEAVFTQTAEDYLNPARPLSEAQIMKVLDAIAYDNLAAGTAVYVANGKRYRQEIPEVEPGQVPQPRLVVTDHTPAKNEPAAFWGDLDQDEITRLEEKDLRETLQGAIEAQIQETEQRVAALLESLQDEGIARPVFFAAGRRYRLDVEGEGGLVVDEAAPPTSADGSPVTWGNLEGDTAAPLVPAYIDEALAVTFDAAICLTEEQMKHTLEALTATKAAEGETTGSVASPVYVSSGKLRRLSAKGEIEAADHAVAQLVLWPFGHDVRPAVQSLGAGGCTDCHAKDAPFFFAEVKPTGPLRASVVASAKPMYELEGAKESIYVRTGQFFKWLIIVTMTLLILHIMGDLFRRAMRAGPRWRKPRE